MSAALSELIGDRFAAVEVERPEGRFTLIVDAEWISFVQHLTADQQDLVDAGDLPRSMLRAVVAGWPMDWVEFGSEIEICESPDGIPHLRLVQAQVRSA